MKRIVTSLLIILCLIAFSNAAKAQKLYIWCPLHQDIYPKTGAFSGVKVNLIITDERKFGRRVRDKCSSGELIESLAGVIRQTYPSVNINQVSNGEVKVEKGIVTIQIKIMQYAATFTPAMWHAYTEYSVKITDSRKETPIEQSLDIPKERSFFNLNGYSTAKHNLSKTYGEANADLLNFISEMLSLK